AALDLVIAFGRVGDRAHVLVGRVSAAPLGLELDLVDRSVLAVFEHDATDALAAVARRDDRDDEPEVLAEVGGQPPVPPRRLPVARPPGGVAKPEAVDLPLLVGDAHNAARADVLLVVTAGEALLGVLGARRAVIVHGLAAAH